MKNVKYILVLCFTIIVFASCDSEVSIEDSKAETEETSKTGNEGNEDDGREEDG